MNGGITRVSMDEAVKEDRTDWERVRALTDEQIDAAIAADPDTYAMGGELDQLRNNPLKFVYSVYSDSAGEWRWRLEGSDGRILAYGAESYPSQSEAVRAVGAVRTAFRKARAA